MYIYSKKQKASGIALNRYGRYWLVLHISYGAPIWNSNLNQAFDNPQEAYEYALTLQVPMLGRWARILAGNTVDCGLSTQLEFDIYLRKFELAVAELKRRQSIKTLKQAA